jgi:translation initiation factor 2 alpha subunit (eIF-2alpha)
MNKEKQIKRIISNLTKLEKKRHTKEKITNTIYKLLEKYGKAYITFSPTTLRISKEPDDQLTSHEFPTPFFDVMEHIKENIEPKIYPKKLKCEVIKEENVHVITPLTGTEYDTTIETYLLTLEEE